MNKRPGDNQAVTVAVFTFPSSHHALRAEKICQEAGLPVLLIPVPREISSDCGVALITPFELQEKSGDLLGQAGVPLLGTYPLTRKTRLWQRLFSDL